MSDDKKSSLIAKTGAMLNHAHDDGQKPARWAVSGKFFLQMMIALYPIPMSVSRVVYTAPIDFTWMGLPVEINPNALHECELIVE